MGVGDGAIQFAPERSAFRWSLIRMRTIKLTLAYDGTAYAGWQVQARGRMTVQEVLERAILEVTGEQVRVMASGRTDAGVHALGQVASFRTESRLAGDVLLRALNSNLPHDVAVLEGLEVAEGFHATLHAVRKRYRYAIHNAAVRDVFRRHFAWHYPVPLDVEAMHRAGAALVGTHDFSSFESSGSERQTSTRTIFDLVVKRGAGEENRLVFAEVEGDGFLYNMVRAIVGTLVQVGRGNRPESWVAGVLAARDRRPPAAPPPPED